MNQIFLLGSWSLSREDISFSGHRAFELLQKITISILILVKKFIIEDFCARASSNPVWVTAISCDCWELSGRVPSYGLTTRTEESNLVCCVRVCVCVCVCDHEACSVMRSWPTGTCWATKKNHNLSSNCNIPFLYDAVHNFRTNSKARLNKYNGRHIFWHAKITHAHKSTKSHTHIFAYAYVYPSPQQRATGPSRPELPPYRGFTIILDTPLSVGLLGRVISPTQKPPTDTPVFEPAILEHERQ